MAAWRDSGSSELARFGFGCVKLGSMSQAAGGSAAKRMIREAIHSGVTLFDTADAYGAGTSERLLAAGLGSDRSKVIVATKGGYLFRERSRLEQGGRRVVAPVLGAGRSIRYVRRWTEGSALATKSAYATQDFTASYLRGAVDDSLRRLRTDYIDVYQLHGPSSVCSDETIQLMAELVRVGKIRAFGVGLERLDKFDDWLRVENLSTLQVPFGILDPEAREAVLPRVGPAGVQIIARGIFGSGLFNGDHPFEGNGPHDAKLQMVQSLRLLADSVGTTPHQLAVWWVLAQQAITTMLVGINSIDHLRSTLRYVTTPLSSADLIGRIDELIQQHGSQGRRG